MTLCVNISPLRFNMTRTEKYRQYREEISNMKFESFTQKREASDTIDKLHNKHLGNKMNFNDVMTANEVLDTREVKIKKRRLINLTKYEIFYFLIALGIITILVLGLIISGLNLWGK